MSDDKKDNTIYNYGINEGLLSPFSNILSLMTHIQRKDDKTYAQASLWLFTQKTSPIRIDNVMIITGWGYERSRRFLKIMAKYGIIKKQDTTKESTYKLEPATEYTKRLVRVIEDFIKHKVEQEYLGGDLGERRD